MAELTTAVNELLKSKKPEENLRTYTDGLGSLYKKMSYLRLSMNYFTLAQMYGEFTKAKKTEVEDAVKAVQKLVGLVLEWNMSEHMDEEAAAIAEAARNSIIAKMEDLTAYIDGLRVYEYMLNRVEFRFKKSDFNNDYYGEKFEKDIIHYITSDKDNSAINMKLGQVIEQLPMRLSKNKFFDILKDSLSLYKGSEKLSVQDFVYMIRTSGTLESGCMTPLASLEKYYVNLKDADYENMDEKTFDFLRGELDAASELATEYSDTYVAFAEVINDIYSIILTGDATVLYDITEKNKLFGIIKKTWDYFEGEADLEDEDAFVFADFEGVQERLSSLIFNPETALEEIEDTNHYIIDKIGMKDVFTRLFKVKLLQSVSTFARLSDEEALHEEADEEYINDITARLIEEFSALFDKHDKKYRRAVMAVVLSGLPAFFNNLEEFKAYMHVALGQCSDDAEKAACMSLINMMITSERSYDME